MIDKYEYLLFLREVIVKLNTLKKVFQSIPPENYLERYTISFTISQLDDLLRREGTLETHPDGTTELVVGERLADGTELRHLVVEPFINTLNMKTGVWTLLKTYDEPVKKRKTARKPRKPEMVTGYHCKEGDVVQSSEI